MAAQVPDGDANRHHVVILDGAVGTELGRRGIDTRSPLFSARALLDDRGRRVLREVHAEYLRAGADIVTAATFRTNRRALEAAGQGSRFPELAQIAVAEAIAARDEHGSGLVAGSMAPLADCYRPEARPPPELAFIEHLEHARVLAMAGCDVLLVETIATGEEGIAAVEAASSTGLPVCAAVQIAPDGKLLDGRTRRSSSAPPSPPGQEPSSSTACPRTASIRCSISRKAPASPSAPTRTSARSIPRSAGRPLRPSTRRRTPHAQRAGSSRAPR
jgi:S-methylmethionine-dependent homocysteine/selenocysteine methylase